MTNLKDYYACRRGLKHNTALFQLANSVNHSLVQDGGRWVGFLQSLLESGTTFRRSGLVGWGNLVNCFCKAFKFVTKSLEGGNVVKRVKYMDIGYSGALTIASNKDLCTIVCTHALSRSIQNVYMFIHQHIVPLYTPDECKSFNLLDRQMNFLRL